MRLSVFRMKGIRKLFIINDNTQIELVNLFLALLSNENWGFSSVTNSTLKVDA